MKTNFHNKNFALRLALKRRQARTRKWPIVYLGVILDKHLSWKSRCHDVKLSNFRSITYQVVAYGRLKKKFKLSTLKEVAVALIRELVAYKRFQI